LEEGRQVRDKIAQERRKIEIIKERKLRELQELEIPDKYQTELAKKKVNF
jgi:hypothetical protein